MSESLATSHVGGIQYEYPRVLPQTRLMQIIKLSQVPTASTEACIFDNRLSLSYPVDFRQDGCKGRCNVSWPNVLDYPPGACLDRPLVEPLTARL